jgi:hypothetical protein
MEFSFSREWSLDIGFGYNPWQFGGHSSLRHWLVQPELRYWPCRVFEGHFWGLHGMYGEYNIGYLPIISLLKDL